MNALTEKQLELIQKYLIDDINEEELSLFNTQLKNLEFRKELMEQARNLDSLKQHVNDSYKSELINNYDKAIPESKQKRNLSKWLLVGISIILISILSYFILPSGDKQIYMADRYFTPYPPDSSIRGTVSPQSFSNAMKHYANANYESAIIDFLKINPKNEKLEIYLACSYLKTNDFNAAYNILNNLATSIENTESNQNIQWFKTLSLLGLNKEDEAKMLLQKISRTDNHIFKTKAVQLLNELK